MRITSGTEHNKTPKDIGFNNKKYNYVHRQRTYRFHPHYIPGWFSLIQVWFQFYFPDF
ncbi:hypothetical protein Q4Q35_14365 [Flavivirga aquimarina]|uniref:Uncharacterized protein n=1 Tax=Flavivirga aquimarina TaxID=2027862 RepID=A0ABT8WD57_9FLAO|nr:hypothetical protein [Flavivirga aquimarina]MDO5970988.1 hypothetical protein [Flavivirga aquimarina]